MSRLDKKIECYLTEFMFNKIDVSYYKLTEHSYCFVKDDWIRISEMFGISKSEVSKHIEKWIIKNRKIDSVRVLCLQYLNF